MSRETLDNPQPATRAESAALLVEVVNIALHGGKDPWGSNANLLRQAKLATPNIEKGHMAQANHKAGGPPIWCKYNPAVRDELLHGSSEKMHIASLVMGIHRPKIYDMFMATADYHGLEEDDVLAKMFSLLEYDEDDEALAAARTLNFEALPEDVVIEVFEDLPTHGAAQRSLGALGMRFATLRDDPGDIAKAEGLRAEAAATDAAQAMELGMATTIDSTMAQMLITALREDYVPIVRW